MSDTLEQRVIDWLIAEGLDVGGAPLSRGSSLLAFVRRELDAKVAQADPPDPEDSAPVTGEG